ncbi:hypothetical protein PHLGIDRAFT_503436 [Phlebiopsis gigantea 11061_1 CR5-6]|uniref:Uncharacterized protein n=1 Tax=Phlebiopsis gigantea (strain 11061_1 CR5-6) TaxID=745531 RepID=A0A0C3PB02_PHLG1|nr:hypothetical protein PHLGIDRAFT_503436 [Phlebiopsis gigantea 11061_1 CR5-6]
MLMFTLIRFLFAYFLQLLTLHCVTANGETITEDDSNHASKYTPSDAWLTGSYCKVCGEALDTSKLSEGSVHVAFYNATDKLATPQNVTFVFTGPTLTVLGVVYPKFASYYTFYINDSVIGDGPLVKSSDIGIYDNYRDKGTNFEPEGTPTTISSEATSSSSTIATTSETSGNSTGILLSSSSYLNAFTSHPVTVIATSTSLRLAFPVSSQTTTPGDKTTPNKPFESSSTSHRNDLVAPLLSAALVALSGGAVGIFYRYRRRRQTRAQAMTQTCHISPFIEDVHIIRQSHPAISQQADTHGTQLRWSDLGTCYGDASVYNTNEESTRALVSTANTISHLQVNRDHSQLSRTSLALAVQGSDTSEIPEPHSSNAHHPTEQSSHSTSAIHLSFPQAPPSYLSNMERSRHDLMRMPNSHPLGATPTPSQEPLPPYLPEWE